MHIKGLVSLKLKIAQHDIKAGISLCMAKMRLAIDRGAADIQAQMARAVGNKLFFLLRKGIVDF